MRPPGRTPNSAGIKAPREWWNLGAALGDLAYCDDALPPCSRPGGEAFSAKAGTDEAERAAVACWTCPVQRLCLDFALANGETAGVWGGRSFDAPRPPGPRPVLNQRAGVSAWPDHQSLKGPNHDHQSTRIRA